MIESFISSAAAAFPERIAVTDGERSLTYAALDRWCRLVCAALRDGGIVPGDRVAVCLPRGLEAVAAIHGAVRAAATYVPVDSDQPRERMRYILSGCAPRYVIVSREMQDCPIDPPAERMEIEAILDAVPPRADPVRHATPQTPAYILYTSGSTGNPKGVVIPKRAAEAFVGWAHDTFRLTSSDRFASFAPFHFDLSVFDLFNAAKCGGELHLIHPNRVLLPGKLLEYIHNRGLTVWYSVPWILAQAAARGHPERFSFQSLRLVLFAGEVFPPRDLNRVMDVFRHARFYNLFGPTETNVCLFYAVPRDRRFSEPVPAGVPCAPDRVWIVDEALKQVPPGTPGELIVAGGTIMDGYWNEPELTGKVVLTSLPDVGSGRYIRTGDRVCLRSDGQIYFLGRMDHQIKRRGFRIEPGEIETAAMGHPEVTACAAVPVAGTTGTRVRLAVEAGDTLTASLLRSYLAKKCPPYMLPDEILIRKRLPRNRNGKIDRRMLKSL